MDKPRVFLADDHHVVRSRLKARIDNQPDMVVVGEAGDGRSALEGAEELSPDVVIMDVTMPVMGGAEATRLLKDGRPSVKVLALTVHEDKSYLDQLIKAGAAGYVIKQAVADDLIHVLHRFDSEDEDRQNRDGPSSGRDPTPEPEPQAMFRRPLLIPTMALGLAVIMGATALADEGWVSLFDGKTLEGWKVNGGNARYEVEGGSIVGTTVEGSPNTFLCKGDYKDFALELEVKCDPALNSGVQVRSHVYAKDDPDPKNRQRAGVVYGPQCEIARKETGTAARFYDEGRRGQWLDEIKPEARDAFQDDGWNRYRIVVQGNRYRSWINGVAASDFTDDADRSGLIGLQVHGIAKGSGPYQVRWRNVRIRELKPGEVVSAPGPPDGFRAVFNGRDLAGWEGSPSYWSAEEGCLTGKADGTLKFNRFLTWRGGTLRNFELRVKVWVSPTGNSGLQYRGTERPDLGETVVTGYQCDVVANRPDYNGMLYEERGRRILAHTGEKVIIDPEGQPWAVGRFPLKPFKPGEWHDYRVLAEGNHQRHWIDGHPTVDVTDLDEKGRKLDGVLAVQVHVGPPMTIRYKDFFLKALPDDLPLIKPEQAVIPPDAPKVAPQGQDKPRKPDAE